MELIPRRVHLNLAKISRINKKVAQDLLQYPPENWCRAFQTPRCSTFMVDNNISESFNSSIFDARHKPIISLLEDIRMIVMSRIRDGRYVVSSWKVYWCPNAMELFEANKQESVQCNVLWNGDNGYEVSDGEDKHIVFIDTMRCTCRARELTGIPCSHAIAAFYSSSMEPLSVMSKWYHRETYRKCYEHAIQPIPDVKFWTVKENDAIEPPPVEKKVGRPKKNRVRASNEPRLNHKLSRKGKVQHCSLCGSTAHKKDKCPQRPSQLSKESQASTSSKSRRGSHAGLGLYVNIETGKQVLNPGGSQSIVINEGTQRESDPNTRFPIPNEAQLRKEKRKREPSKKQAIEPFKAPQKKKEDDKCNAQNSYSPFE
ncbi:uncharacterized protein LOC131008240 [Salvia miltiorrhiza]|uniref:uncharacterized protein LOC131008240 n=1 Tax=Salvia miltiorrhiza TaxID=226208 RepID=UPI0025AD3620|nr:uncharacterized protein LOC131008240 [Salvia miltiorrhiza]